jgi:inosose dehydratase
MRRTLDRTGRSPDDTARIAIANAPCSFGAFEVTLGVYDGVPTGIEVLDHIAAAGYDGVDLGPVGYLGSRHELGERLRARELALAGGYVGIPFSDPDCLSKHAVEIDQVIDFLDAAPSSGPPPRPTLVDAGSPARVASPGWAATDPSLGLDDEGWDRFAAGVEAVADRFRDRGYEPTFHPHTATYVEAVWEIERFLELTDVGMCIDTGHVLIGGGEPAQCIRDWATRINHIHIKDANRGMLAEIVHERAPVSEIWRRRAFTALGAGDIDLDEVTRAINDIEYRGWIVIEQDIFPDPPSFPQTIADQAANRAFLRERGI